MSIHQLQATLEAASHAVELLGDCTLVRGDCIEVMKSMPDNSVHAVITDPPYGLEFMGEEWDAPWQVSSSSALFSDRATAMPGFSVTRNPTCRGCGGRLRGATKCSCEVPAWDETLADTRTRQMRSFQAWCELWARECLRVVRPGGHLLAFGGTRTYHRLASAVEDAGFEIRDQIGWAYGSGFPKSHRVSIDFEKTLCDHIEVEPKKFAWLYKSDGAPMLTSMPFRHPAANEWAGYGTALKPAWEPIVVARKALDGTNADNLEKWGVGALNIDGCRVPSGSDYTSLDVTQGGHHRHDVGLTGDSRNSKFEPGEGRWPANVIHDGSNDVVEAFPVAPGQLADESRTAPSAKTSRVYGAMKRQGEPSQDDPNEGAVGFKMKPGARRLDSGSAARFFYCAKASRADRDAGLDGMTKGTTSDGQAVAADNPYQRGKTERANTHPTVKPTDLMRYLCRLVTPPGGTVLDPFMGSGSSGRGAVLEGFHFVGVEREQPYFAIAMARIRAAIRTAEDEAAAKEAEHPDLFAGGAP